MAPVQIVYIPSHLYSLFITELCPLSRLSTSPLTFIHCLLQSYGPCPDCLHPLSPSFTVYYRVMAPVQIVFIPSHLHALLP
jgi:hypothetical protein